MPHDRLTPLGRQLRTVLANLRSSVTGHPPLLPVPLDHIPSRSFISGASSPFPLEQHVSYPLHRICGPRDLSTSARRAHVGEGLDIHDVKGKRRTRKHNLRKSDGPSVANHIAQALTATGKQHLMNKKAVEKRKSLSHLRFKNKSNRLKYGTSRSNERMRLQQILASYIEHTDSSMGTSTRFHTDSLTPPDVEYVKSKGFDRNDVPAWADIISAEDSLSAAQLIEQAIDERGPLCIPAFVYLQVLHREYISARGLRLILQHFSTRLNSEQGIAISNCTSMISVFLVVIRMVRHARKVWPESLPAIADLTIQHLGRIHHPAWSKDSRRWRSALSGITIRLNRIMSLMSLPIAGSPFKSNHVQERAVARILQFMSDHDPPLHPNREGYRAVIRLQLAQRKSTDEQLWAQLKTLSWPPWKASRTGMDDLIGPEQGISKAHETLRQMQRAGYAHLRWEKAVRTYAGWDVDGTPTIQTRALVPRGVPKIIRVFDWVARIGATRTVQEAWACYLAWEDLKLPPNDDILLSIFKKLHQEENRLRKKADVPHENDSDTWPVLPGDSREIAPLPPSTHLHTYTRSTPPSVDDFYNHLHDHDVPFRHHLLAYVVANANSFQTGVLRLRHGIQSCSEIQGLVSLSRSPDLSAIPDEVFAAAIKLFCRFAHVAQWEEDLPLGNPNCLTEALTTEISAAGGLDLDYHLLSLNQKHLVTHALELLKSRRTNFRPAWNAALEGLTREANFKNLRSLVIDQSFSSNCEQRGRSRVKNEQLQYWGGALIAYRLVRRTLTLYREMHLDLDATAFRLFCIATENMAIAGWAVLRMSAEQHSEPLKRALGRYQNDAKHLLRSSSHEERLKGEFRILVGEAEPENSAGSSDAPSMQSMSLEENQLGIPRLLHTPSPALLHAYVRAIGWLADHDGLYRLVEWMMEHQEELAERRDRDRSGEVMMRRTFVAIRVFMERSWLQDHDSGMTEAGTLQLDRREKILQRLQRVAEPDLIRKVEGIVESIEGSGGWPTEEEVADYCQDHRFSSLEQGNTHL